MSSDMSTTSRLPTMREQALAQTYRPPSQLPPTPIVQSKVCAVVADFMSAQGVAAQTTQKSPDAPITDTYRNSTVVPAHNRTDERTVYSSKVSCKSKQDTTILKIKEWTTSTHSNGGSTTIVHRNGRGIVSSISAISADGASTVRLAGSSSCSLPVMFPINLDKN